MIVKKLVFACVLTSCGLMAACSTPTEITTKDGHTTMAADKPEVDEDSDFIKYDKNGQEVQMNKSEVRDMKEVK
ncbi:YgdI/YgdR family lipoprotein [Allopusillimonas ginsengisoli]|uniref:YgdI/YgdR family lipoprotein n=1 Tax=Allopusillimonas ginsengisoli TaxID=453575 RepID=UPI0010C23C8D|nr:YgdI/YgdR family lipoprotein [Allopusillimonas ginsengisoli]